MKSNPKLVNKALIAESSFDEKKKSIKLTLFSSVEPI